MGPLRPVRQDQGWVGVRHVQSRACGPGGALLLPAHREHIDPKNVVAQGPRCNLFLHGNPGAFADYILREHGPQELERLTRRANQVRKDWRADEVRILIGHLERGDFAGFEMAYYEVNL